LQHDEDAPIDFPRITYRLLQHGGESMQVPYMHVEQ
jgi:hypothetical protein